MRIIDKSTGEAIASVTTNHSLTFDEAMDLAGFESVDGGWVDADGTLWDESVAELNEEA